MFWLHILFHIILALLFISSLLSDSFILYCFLYVDYFDEVFHSRVMAFGHNLWFFVKHCIPSCFFQLLFVYLIYGRFILVNFMRSMIVMSRTLSTQLYLVFYN